jgi:hypothetical protein
VAHAALRSALFPIPVLTLFWKDQIGMSFVEIMTLQAIFALVVVVLEFPSGYVADRIGHRAALRVGALLWAAGWIAYATGRTFAGMAGAEALLAVGTAFTSGADSALLFGALDAAGRGSRYAAWEGRVRAAAQTAEAVAAAAGGALYAAGPRLPIWLQVPVAGAALATTAGMREPPRAVPGTRLSHARRALDIVGATLWRRPRLRTTVGLSVVLGLSSFYLVWLIQPYMQARGVPEAWFGPIWAGAHLWLAGASLASDRAVSAFGPRGTLLACCLLIAAGYGGLAAGEAAASFLFYLCLMTVRGLQGPILLQYLQREAPAGDRASVLSLNAMLFRAAFVLTGPLVGLVVERLGMAAALAILGTALTLVALAALAAFARAHAAAR